MLGSSNARRSRPSNDFPSPGSKSIGSRNIKLGSPADKQIVGVMKELS